MAFTKFCVHLSYSPVKRYQINNKRNRLTHIHQSINNKYQIHSWLDGVPKIERITETLRISINIEQACTIGHDVNYYGFSEIFI